MKNLDNIVTDLVLGHDNVWSEPQTDFNKNVDKLSAFYQKIDPVIESTQSFQELLESLKNDLIKVDEDYFTEGGKFAQDSILYALGLTEEDIGFVSKRFVNDVRDTTAIGDTFSFKQY